MKTTQTTDLVAKRAPSKRTMKQLNALILAQPPAENEGSKGFTHLSDALIFCPLPAKRQESTTLVRSAKTADGELSVKFYVAEGETLPYGKDSLLLDLLCHEAKLHKTPEITFERAKELLEKLGDNDSGASYRRVRQSLERLAHLTIRVHRGDAFTKMDIIESADLGSPTDAKREAIGARRIFPYAIRFSDRFFEDLQRHYTPLPEAVLLAFKGFPSEYAIMKRLLRRERWGRTVSVIAWSEACPEFCPDDTNERRAKATIKKVLLKLAAFREDLRIAFQVTKDGLQVTPKKVKTLPTE